MRILLISHSYGLFGAERSLLQFAERLHADESHQILMLIPREGRLSARCRELGLDVIVRRYSWWISADWRLRDVLRHCGGHVVGLCGLFGPVRRFAPDIIYTNTGVVPIGAILARLLRVPHVWHLREFVRKNRNMCYDLGERVVGNSHALGSTCDKFLGHEDVVVVYNGFDFGPPAAGDDARYHTLTGGTAAELLYVTSVIPGRGLEDTVAALAVLIRRTVRLTPTDWCGRKIAIAIIQILVSKGGNGTNQQRRAANARPSLNSKRMSTASGRLVATQ